MGQPGLVVGAALPVHQSPAGLCSGSVSRTASPSKLFVPSGYPPVTRDRRLVQGPTAGARVTLPPECGGPRGPCAAVEGSQARPRWCLPKAAGRRRSRASLSAGDVFQDPQRTPETTGDTRPVLGFSCTYTSVMKFILQIRHSKRTSRWPESLFLCFGAIAK